MYEALGSIPSIEKKKNLGKPESACPTSGKAAENIADDNTNNSNTVIVCAIEHLLQALFQLFACRNPFVSHNMAVR